MRGILTICLILLSACVASAQHDLYKWQLSGYTGVANYLNKANSTPDYFKVNNNLLYRLELTRSLGNTLGLSVSYDFGKIRGRDMQGDAFTTDERMTSVRAYFYTDNGWLFNTSARVSPYVFGGYGLGIYKTNSNAAHITSDNLSAIPVGVGLKFRLAERWLLALQTEAVYLTNAHLTGAALEQNSQNSSYMHTGFRLGYSFGFKKSTFNAPRFYADNIALLQSVATEAQPRQNALEILLKLEPREVQLAGLQDSLYRGTVEKTAVPATYTALPAPETLPLKTITFETDSSQKVRSATKVKSMAAASGQSPDTTEHSGALRTISSARTHIRIDSVLTVEALPAAPVTQQKVVARDSSVVKQAAPRQQVQAQRDSPVTTKPVSTTPDTVRVLIRERVPITKAEPARMAERVVYVPANTTPTPAQQITVANTPLLEEQRRLNELKLEVSSLQARIDSIQAVQPPQDTMAAAPTVVVVTDTAMVQKLQQQAALNDSVLQRLNQYEKEIAQLKQAKAPVAAKPLAVSPEMYATTVFYPINAHAVPAESLKDLNQVLKALQENADAQVKLTGYTSQSGIAAYNLALSRKRVAGLVEFLTGQGIAQERIKTEYLGDAKSSQQENPLDRKVEIRLIPKQ